MKPGVTEAQANADMQRIAGELEREYPDSESNHIAAVTSLLARTVEDVRPALLLLLCAAGALLLITCADVASLLLARSVSRSRETAVRVALGGSIWQLFQQYFSEGLLVSLVGAALGALLSVALVRAVVTLASSYIPRADEIRLNWQVLLLAVLLAIVCAVLFSLAPLWQASRIAPNEVLSEGVRASSGIRSRSLLRLFVVVEIALAFALLAASAFFLQRLAGLDKTNPGFDPNHVLSFRIFTAGKKYRTEAERIDIETRLSDDIKAVPGVEASGFTSRFPLSGCCEDTFLFPGDRKLDFKNIAESIPYDFELRFVSPGYFQAMRIPLLAGRYLQDHDRALTGTVMPVVISQTIAAKLWPHRNAVGQSATISSWDKGRFRIAGVVGDVRDISMSHPPRGDVYLSYRQVPPEVMLWAVRSPLDQATLTRALSAAARSVDPEQPIFDIRPLWQVVRDSLSLDRLETVMVSFFALSALLLSMLGVYGIVSYSVRQRTPEMGTAWLLELPARVFCAS